MSVAVRKTLWLRLTAVVVALLLSVTPAAAAPRTSTQAELAAAHYQAGQQAYGEERFAEALREFELGYALAPRPEFLINFAQVHRKLGRLGDASIDCERYLAAAPTSPMATEVSRLLVAIREEQAAQLRAPHVEPRPTKEPPPPVVPPPPIAPPGVTLAREAPPRSHRRRNALIGGLVAGGVVLVGVAITLGVVLTRGNQYPDAPLRGDFR